MHMRLALVLLLAVQALCALFFVSDIVLSVLGVPRAPLGWHLREIMEIGAALGLVIGLVSSALLFQHSFRQLDAAEARIERTTTDFMILVDRHFTEWGLTPAERDVALFALKGLSIAEIARLRTTSEGTVKAQTNAIYRKAGVSGRNQLMSLFIDDLMADTAPGRPAAEG
jgi:DNA-binding CsgD family transcriptional regulator